MEMMKHYPRRYVCLPTIMIDDKCVNIEEIKVHFMEYFNDDYISKRYDKYVKKLNSIKGYIIYRLLRNGVVVYVGQTRQTLHQRICQHKESGKEFDRVEYIEFNNGCTFAQAEIYFINLFYIPGVSYNIKDVYNEKPEPDEKFDCREWQLAVDDNILSTEFRKYKEQYLQKKWNNYYGNEVPFK